MEFDYTLTTNQSFEESVESVHREIADAGMRVLHVHDVQQTLSDKGFAREPFKIVEFCSAKFAHEFLNKDIRIGLCLPCKINVYIKDEITIISGMRPTILLQLFPNTNLDGMPQEIDQIIRNIIDHAATN